LALITREQSFFLWPGAGILKGLLTKQFPKSNNSGGSRKRLGEEVSNPSLLLRIQVPGLVVISPGRNPSSSTK
jgi:hypothetical protein